jgi:STE24 endopeptidase
MAESEAGVNADLELEPASPEVKRYQRQKLTVKLFALGADLGVLLLLALVLGPRLQEPLQALAGDCRWLQLVGMALILGVSLEIISLPLDFYSGYILEHRYKLSTQTLRSWVWKRLKGHLVGGLIGLPLLLGLYALIWLTEPWWLWAAVGWLAVTLVLGRLAPILILPLFYKVTPLEDADLRQRLEKLAHGTGLTLEGVYRLHLSEETRKANAALTGLGRSRRVLLGDTLLEQFTPEEIEVVFAHEVGHHVYRHLPKMVAWSVLTSTIGFWLVDVVLRNAAENLRYASFDAPAALPLVMVVLSLFGLMLTPVQNAVSRFFERQCDRYALQRTGKPQAYRSAFAKLARLNKSDPDPNPLVVWLMYDHPPIRQRIAVAD